MTRLRWSSRPAYPIGGRSAPAAADVEATVAGPVLPLLAAPRAPLGGRPVEDRRAEHPATLAERDRLVVAHRARRRGPEVADRDLRTPPALVVAEVEVVHREAAVRLVELAPLLETHDVELLVLHAPRVQEHPPLVLD